MGFADAAPTPNTRVRVRVRVNVPAGCEIPNLDLINFSDYDRAESGWRIRSKARNDCCFCFAMQGGTWGHPIFFFSR
jgi:hypothetical protein